MTMLTAQDFRSELFIPMPNELVAKLGLRDAYVLSAIRFRTNTRHRDTVDVDGILWWRTSIPDLASFLAITVAQTRAALKSLIDMGALESASHAVKGWPDRTLSYRANVPDSNDSICQNPTPHISRNPTDVPLLIKELNNAKSKKEAGDKDGKATLLPDDWKPSDKQRLKAEALGVDVDVVAEDMRKWAFVGDKRRASWAGTFNSFLSKAKPTLVSVPSAESQVDRIIASGDREALERLTGVRFDPDFGDVSPRERFELLKVEWPGWARENRVRLVSAAVSHSKPR